MAMAVGALSFYDGPPLAFGACYYCFELPVLLITLRFDYYSIAASI
jgi:hypothetical protein